MDVISLAAGAAVALILGAAIFAFRHRLQALGSSVGTRAASTRARLSRSVDARYRQAITETASSWHIAGHLVALEQIAVQPSFYVPPAPPSPFADESDDGSHVYEGPLNMLPFIPDWPQLVAPYRLPGLPITQVLRGEDSLVLLGLPGSGRSVALALMAIYAARQTEDDQAGGLLGEARLPILFHLADLDLSTETWGIEEVDPLLPLIEAARARLRGLATQWVGAIRKPFAAGRGLILVDGWDELPPLARQQAAEWLAVLIRTYPGNKLVVAGPARGYAPLLEIGLAPAYVLPWGATEYNELGHLWGKAWPEIGAKPSEVVTEPHPDVIARALRGIRARSPMDVTLQLWTTLARDNPGQGRRGWFSVYIQRILPAPELRPALEQMALADFNTPLQIGLTIDEISVLLDRARASLTDKPAISNADFLYSLTSETRLLTERIGKRLTFTQPLVGAYLAAEALSDSNFREDLLEDSLSNDLLMPFLAQVQDITPYVQQRMAQATTILNDRILALAAWAADADPKAGWRGELFKQIAAYLIGPAEYPLTRQRALAALVASRDRNVNFVFLQGLQSEDNFIRVLSTLGLGALGDPELVTQLGELLADPVPDVEAAAALALGAIGTKPAVNYIIESLLAGSDLARRAVAEMMALNLAGEGHDILREAVLEQDPRTRKAAVHGLARVRDEWVIPLLETAEIRDDQWIVRSAAIDALTLLREHSDPLPARPLPPDEHRWLVQWLAARNAGIAPGAEGVRQLVRALQEGDEEVRQAAAQALGQLATPEAITPLYLALRDPEAAVRDAAHRALGSASLITGMSFPGVM